DDVGPAADLYALGLLLRELLTGRRPPPHDPNLPLPRAIGALLDRRHEPPASLRALNPDVPHALDAIVAKLLAPCSADRYPDGHALAEDLTRFLHRKPPKYTR